MNCLQCGAHQEEWGFVALCDRCLKAKLWDQLEADDYIIIRRKPGSDRLWLKSQQNGDWKGTDLTALHLDLRTELDARITEVFGA